MVYDDITCLFDEQGISPTKKATNKSRRVFGHDIDPLLNQLHFLEFAIFLFVWSFGQTKSPVRFLTVLDVKSD
jgi:hypothetical protein